MGKSGHKLKLAERIERAFGATFAGKGDALLVALEAEAGADEVALLRADGLGRLRGVAVEGVTAVKRVGETAALLTVRPERGSTANRRERRLEVRRLKDFKVLATIVEDRPGGIAASPDGKRLAVAHDFGALNLWDAAKGKLLSTFEAKGVGGVAYSPDGSLLAAKEFAGKLQVFDAKESVEEPLRSINVGGRETQVAFHPSEPWVAVVTGKAIKLADAGTGKILDSIETTKKEQQDGIGHMAFSPDGKLLATSTLSEGVVALWDVGRAEHLGHVLELGEPLSGLEFDAAGERLLVATYEGAGLYELA